MRKIVLSDYTFEGHTFQVRPSISVILFNEPKLDGREIIRRDELAKKIESTAKDFVLLENAEYAKLVSGLSATNLEPFGRSAVEFIKRILDAPEVAVQEKT